MIDDTSLHETSRALDDLTVRTQALTISAGGFARAMTQAFSSSVSGGKQFADVLKTLALRVSSLAVTAAFKPLTASLTSGISSLFSALAGSIGSLRAGPCSRRHQAVRCRRRDRRAELFPADGWRRRPRRGGGTRSDHAAVARA